MEKITKEMRDGECVYLDDTGKEISTYAEDIDWIVRVRLEPLRDFLNIDFDANAGTIQFIACALLEQAEKNIYEAAKYIKEKHGEVEIVRACHHQAVEPETMLDIVFKPCLNTPEAG